MTFNLKALVSGFCAVLVMAVSAHAATVTIRADNFADAEIGSTANFGVQYFLGGQPVVSYGSVVVEAYLNGDLVFTDSAAIDSRAGFAGFSFDITMPGRYRVAAFLNGVVLSRYECYSVPSGEVCFFVDEPTTASTVRRFVVDEAAVPIPAAAFLFVPALAGAAAIRRRTAHR